MVMAAVRSRSWLLVRPISDSSIHASLQLPARSLCSSSSAPSSCLLLASSSSARPRYAFDTSAPSVRTLSTASVAGVGTASDSLSRTIFVRPRDGKNLISPIHTFSLLSQLAARFGPIQSFHFPREPQGQRLLGYGSVTFREKVSVAKALSNDGMHTITLPSALPSRLPRTYLSDEAHSRLVGTDELTSCKAPTSGEAANKVHLSSRSLQNPSSLRPGWGDVALLMRMKAAITSHFVDESEASEGTPADAVVLHSSDFFISTQPMSVEVKLERRVSELNSRPSARQQRRTNAGRDDASPDAKSALTSTVSRAFQQFGGFRRATNTRPSSNGALKSESRFGDLDGHHRSLHTGSISTRGFATFAGAENKAKRKAEWQRNRHSNFVDQLHIRITGGKGGDGCVSFHREKFVPYGPPSGGNGGAGGSIYIRAVDGPTSLARVSRRFRGADGQHGQGSFLHGRKADDKIIEVPVGTVVTASKRLRITEEEEAQEYHTDLLRRAAKAGWDPTGMVIKEDVVLAVEAAERRRILQAKTETDIAGSPDADADNASASTTSEKAIVEGIDGESLLEPEEALQLQAVRDRVWRHYPRAEETNYRRNEFRAAEMRLALDRRRRRRFTSATDGDLTDRSAASVTPYEDEQPSEMPWRIDLDEPTPADSSGILLAAGGRGGLGNPTFLSSNNRSPKFATRGEWGESLEVTLELKRPSDIGLVGLPNAGKSTILRSISASKAQVGHWRFTTLSPNLGVVRLDGEGKVLGVDTSEVNEGYGSDMESFADTEGEEFRLTMSDIPGLIDGAADNRGLGHTFLRHIERCTILAYVLDLTASEPHRDLQVLHNELSSYRADLAKKAELIIVNKADLFGDETEIQNAKEKLGLIESQARMIWADIEATLVGPEADNWQQTGPMKLVTISAKKKQGTDKLAKALVDLLKARRARGEAT
ncbi:GTP-binding protein Obg/CgtA [Testicularia cyperi]|uniref:GTP-binding protein Obg/CgtA n=1 Tax=Testicularia cyperi TaxID=1882483 RepID=A0A317XPV8_9BASI|nr:GTP-binding protein Obg/CgtA [Testicularia cyperi]